MSERVDAEWQRICDASKAAFPDREPEQMSEPVVIPITKESR